VGGGGDPRLRRAPGCRGQYRPEPVGWGRGEACPGSDRRVRQADIDPEHGKKTAPQGAATIVFAATSPLLAEIGGVYLKDSDISQVDDEPRPMSEIEPPSEVMSHSIDPRSAERLWGLSEQLLIGRPKPDAYGA
jgi:hypothetical protein